MDDVGYQGFISLGCKTDRDCAYRDDNGEEIFNYQSCRTYPNKGLPAGNSTNGCICRNYITAASIDGKSGRVFCTKSDKGSIAIYVFDCSIIILQLVISFQCLHLLVFFGILKVKQVWRSGILRERRISSVKRHSLLCTFLLFMNSLCFSIFRVVTLIGNILGLKSDIDIKGEQAAIDEGSFRSINWLQFMFFELCCLHFTILWMSTTKTLFSKEASHRSSNCFNAKFYTIFIYIMEIGLIMCILALIVIRARIAIVNLVLLLIGVVIVYEFAWGCGNIIQMLRFIASWSRASRLSSVSVDIGIHEAETVVKLLRVADRIEKFSSRIRISGALLILFYGTYSLLNYLG